jgi:hypothetical protein
VDMEIDDTFERHETILISRSASPTAARLTRFISEYLREITSPFAPPRNAALVHSRMTGGQDQVKLERPVVR